MPIPREPRKNDVFVVVEISEPTVSCDVVAMRAVPFAFDVMIEFGANCVAPVPPFGIPSVPVSVVSDKQVPPIA